MTDKVYNAYIDYTLFGETYRTSQAVSAPSEWSALSQAESDFADSHIESCKIQKISVKERTQ